MTHFPKELGNSIVLKDISDDREYSGTHIESEKKYDDPNRRNISSSVLGIWYGIKLILFVASFCNVIIQINNKKNIKLYLKFLKAFFFKTKKFVAVSY